MNERQRQDEYYAVWKELHGITGRCWQWGVGDEEPSGVEVQAIAAELKTLAGKLLHTRRHRGDGEAPGAGRGAVGAG